MKEEEVTLWVNVYKSEFGKYFVGSTFKDKFTAENIRDTGYCVGTYPITIKD